MMTRWKALGTLGVLGIAGLLGGCDADVQFVPSLFTVTVLPPEDGTGVYRVGSNGWVEVPVEIQIGRNIGGTASVRINAKNLPAGVFDNTIPGASVVGLLENETGVDTLRVATSGAQPGTYTIDVIADGDFRVREGLIEYRTEQTSFTLEVFCSGPFGEADGDIDGDGVPDCEDGCPFDPEKIDPGSCGCGVSDADANQNGVPDCNEGGPITVIVRPEIDGRSAFARVIVFETSGSSEGCSGVTPSPFLQFRCEGLIEGTEIFVEAFNDEVFGQTTVIVRMERFSGGERIMTVEIQMT